MAEVPRSCLTSEHAARLEAWLRAALDDELVEFLWRLRRRRDAGSPPAEVLARARDLELVDSGPGLEPRLTALGGRVSDSLTEHAYWKRRGRRHHWSDEVPALGLDRLRGRRILEVGCGAGVNLLSLGVSADVVGIDSEPLYLQLSSVLARLESLPVPNRVCGAAERLPFADGSFDVALFHGSLPYMRIELALCEAARVLRPGGRLVAVQSDLWQFARIRARQRGWSLLAPGTFAREARALSGMACYAWLGRRLLGRSAPVHVTGRRMRRWLAAAGLRVHAQDSRSVAQEFCHVADKPANAPSERTVGERAEPGARERSRGRRDPSRT